MSKVSKIAAGLAAVPVLVLSGSAFAASAGTLGGGDNYVAKNITKGTAYSNSTAAACNETIQYSMQLTNTQFGALQNVTLKVSLPSQGGVSTATATTDLGGMSGTSDTTTVTLPSGANQTVVNGSTELFDSNAHSIKALPDTVATSGVNIGTLEGSTTEFVNFKAKVNCPSTPKEIQVCNLTTKKVETIKEDQFDSSKYSKDLTKCHETTTPPTVLANTGPGQVAGIVAATGVAATAGAHFILGRRSARQ